MQAVPSTDKANRGILNLGVICTVYLPRDKVRASPEEPGGKALKMFLEHFLELTPRLILEEVRSMSDISEMKAWNSLATVFLKITFPLPSGARNRTHLIAFLREVAVMADIEFIDFDNGDGSMIRVYQCDDQD